MRTQLVRRALLAGAGLALSALPVACGGGDTGAPSGTPKFNDADVEFAQNMIPHHEQAVEMAKLADDRASNPKIKKLAAEIEAAQGPEIKTLRGWLKKWGESEAGDNGHAAHGGMDDMDGTMPEHDMKRLENANGAKFDRMFAEMMIAHHEGAIEMAKDEIADGVNPDAIELAKTIKRIQADEVQTLEDMIDRL